MKIFCLPDKVKALIFDIDNTLYRNDPYCALQVEQLVDRFAKAKNLSQPAACELIESCKSRYEFEHDGRKTSTGNIMLELGIPLAENARWRDELFEPEQHLSRDPATIEALRILSERYRLGAVTNNTEALGTRTLIHLGLEGMFSVLIGLDTCFVSKPAPRPYLAALEQLETPPGRAVSIGDRFDVDLEVPIALGMGGILVEELEDIYLLPEVISR